MGNHVSEVAGNRGKKMVKATSPDSSSYTKGADVKSMLTGSKVGGSKDNLSHSITSGKVPGGN